MATRKNHHSCNGAKSDDIQKTNKEESHLHDGWWVVNFEVPSGRASCHPPHLRLNPRCACRQPAMASGALKLGVQHDRTLISWEKEVFSCCRQPLSLRASSLFQSSDPSAPLLCNRRFPQCSLQRCAPKDIDRFELLNEKCFCTHCHMTFCGSISTEFTHTKCAFSQKWLYAVYPCYASIIMSRFHCSRERIAQ